MDIQYGWKCPQCSAIIAPSQTRCVSCSMTKTVTGYAGTVTIGSTAFHTKEWTVGFGGSCGTIFMGPRVKSVATQAQETVESWKAKGFSAKALVAAALDTLIDEDDCEEDEDDEGD